ncbi:MAG: glutathione peroxidase [Paludibacteraceae bacterium]|nr:glutathione peroxidase [Paludibacteraceae bacterium]
MKRIVSLTISLIISLASIAQNSVYDFTVRDNKGNDTPLSKYKGKVLLVVNTATHCGHTPQYKELEELYESYKDKGFEILDFPCNQFGAQAPGTDEEIEQFCTTNYNTKFPRFTKVEVNGENEAPLFSYLKDKKNYVRVKPKNKLISIKDIVLVESEAEANEKPDIYWNFTKFLVNKKGQVIARFESAARTESLAPAIEALLK